MPANEATANDDAGLFEMPSAIHSYEGEVIGAEVCHEQGIFCPWCGKRQPIPKYPPHNLAQCVECRKWYHWDRIVQTYYMTSTMPLANRPR